MDSPNKAVWPLNRASSYNERGEEVPDPRPTQLAIDFKAPTDLNTRVHQLVQNSLLQQELDAAGIETFAEADDFEMEDKDPNTPYEENFDPLFTTAREQEIRAGFVQEIPREVVEKAREIIAASQKKPEAINKPEALEPKELKK